MLVPATQDQARASAVEHQVPVPLPADVPVESPEDLMVNLHDSGELARRNRSELTSSGVLPPTKTSSSTILDLLGAPLEDDDEWADESPPAPLASAHGRSKESVVLSSAVTARSPSADDADVLRKKSSLPAPLPKKDGTSILSSLGKALEDNDSFLEDRLGDFKLYSTWKQVSTSR